jgi:hypothetical protein
MAPFISRLLSNFWVRMFLALCLYLALELTLFAIFKQVRRATVGELAGPYLAFAVPGVIMLLAAWWLRRWEEQSPSPKRVALGWCLAALLFFSAVATAFFYSGLKLHLLNASDAQIFMVVGPAGVLFASFSLYRMALSSISARAVRDAKAHIPSRTPPRAPRGR